MTGEEQSPLMLKAAGLRKQHILAEQEAATGDYHITVVNDLWDTFVLQLRELECAYTELLTEKMKREQLLSMGERLGIVTNSTWQRSGSFRPLGSSLRVEAEQDVRLIQEQIRRRLPWYKRLWSWLTGWRA